MKSQSANFNLMTSLARRVGNALLRDFAEIQNLTASVAGTDKIANRARQRADTAIRHDLAEARPDYAIRSDVIGIVAGTDPRREWLVSAISGYENFRNGIPHWAVAIALKDKNIACLAVLYDPYKNEMFRSQKGQGAYVNNIRLRSAPRNKPQHFLVALDHTGPPCPVPVRQLASRVQSVRCSGAAALDLAYLAAGRIHAFIGTGRESTDRIAAEAILLESGGMTGPAPPFPPESGLYCAAGTNGFEPFIETLASTANSPDHPNPLFT